ncbi:hypothetical protein B0A52_07834 [Exophiala mesophila]|uniref:Uncharacterized protein n=1 Tax=Exophiala mesophila TaxID=212818 RepID=A0A438MVD4_EXOME|nr:hypothetical protein B0A52_07834 [Exophiala mesophila]
MIPVDGAVNPWKTTYPVIALQQSSPAHKSLYHAILAQSAFHLYNVHPSGSDISKFNRRKGLEHYVNSLTQLRTCLNTPSPDYEACVAALLTIAVVEGVYASETKQWRCHFQGAIGFITDFMQQTPWLVSRDAWVLSQSLVLSFEVAQTSRTMIENRPTIIDDLCEAVSLQANFGYTIGASRDVLYALSTIRKLRIQLMKKEEIHQDQFATVVEDLIRTLSSEKLDALPASMIEECDTTEPRSENEQKSEKEKKNNYLQVLHRRIFRNAALIYLYRTIFNAVPAIIEQYISRALADTVEFLDLHGGSVSAWPVFMAAVEACSETDRANATKWLACSCALGIQNRHAIREIVESVWRERDEQAIALDTTPDQVEVDWTQVQQALKIDLLLI